MIMRDNKNKPAVRFVGFTDDWERLELGEIANVYDGVHQTPDYKSQGVMFLSVENISSLKSEKYISEEAFERNYKVYPEYGDILMTRIGDVGTPNVVKTTEKLAYYVSLALLKPKGIDSYFLCNSILSPSFQKGLKDRTLVTAIPQKINKEEIGKVNISIPTSPKERQLVGCFFDQINTLITLQQRKYEKLVNVKKSMLEKMFPKDGELVPEIRFAGFTGAWERRKLGEIGKITTGNTPSTAVSDYYSNDGIVWVTPTDINENITVNSEKKLSESGKQVARVVPKNTILVTCIASIGKNTMLGNTGSFNQQINGLTPDENKYDPYFLLTESALWSAQMKKSAAAATMQIVNRTEFSELKTWIPDLKEQKVIGMFFRNLDTLITLQQRKLKRLQNIKKACLEKMFV